MGCDKFWVAKIEKVGEISVPKGRNVNNRRRQPTADKATKNKHRQILFFQMTSHSQRHLKKEVDSIREAILTILPAAHAAG